MYDEDDAQISLLLADTLLKLHRGARAVALVDRQLERQLLLSRHMSSSTQSSQSTQPQKEITPRLEAAAAQFQECSCSTFWRIVIATVNEKAEALYKSLLSSQPTPKLTGLWPIRS